MNTCPYQGLPDSSYWKRAIAEPEGSDVDPVLNPSFTISSTDRIATAGSCFAQHISRMLASLGDNYLVTEPGHPMLPADISASLNYGVYTARYGNQYTPRQLLQTLQRAHGDFTPRELHWEADGGFVDPFRPFIQPTPFASEVELRVDRESHFAAIRAMVASASVFVFTLGLTEAWNSIEDGAVFPVAPGCGAGVFDETRHEFVNFSIGDVLADLQALVDYIRARNSEMKFLLTVSPVPLIATFENQHVLAATTYSKSLLRVAAGDIASANEQVDYFPSYEIITGNFNRGEYYLDDFREVGQIGVDHAMRCFGRHYVDVFVETPPSVSAPARSHVAPLAVETDSNADAFAESRRAAEVVCDEEEMSEHFADLGNV